MPKKGVFIIESLTFEDEKHDRFEGKFLSRILKLGGINTDYYYIRTLKEFEKVLEIFVESEFRYLHISCHGNEDFIETTLDQINFEQLSEMLESKLKFRRLFISACLVVNKNLAENIFLSSKCYSIIGFDKVVYFSEAAITWASFYHLLSHKDKINTDNVSPILKSLSALYAIPINYFKVDKSSKNEFRLKKFNG